MTQISLAIRPVWSEPSLSAWRKLGSLTTQWALSEGISIRLGGCPGWSETLLGAQSFCWFCHEAAHFFKFKDNGAIQGWAVAWWTLDSSGEPKAAEILVREIKVDLPGTTSQTRYSSFYLFIYLFSKIMFPLFYSGLISILPVCLINHMSHVMRKPVFAICEQQRHLCCSLLR